LLILWLTTTAPVNVVAAANAAVAAAAAARRLRFRFHQQVVLHQITSDQQVRIAARGRVQLLVHLLVGHERRGRARAKQHAARGVVVVVVVGQQIAGHRAQTGAGRQHRDRGRRVQRVDHLDFERFDVETRQRRVVIERGALR